MIFDQAINIFQIMSSNINFQPFFAYVLTEKRFSFSAQQIGLKRKKWLFFLFISLWENTLQWKKSQRNNKTQSTTVQIYTFWSWKELWKKLWPIRLNLLFLQPIRNKNKTKRECVTWLARVSRAWHGMYVIAECFKFWLAHCAGCVCCDWLFHRRH